MIQLWVLPVQKEGFGIVTVGFSANPESGEQVTIPEKNRAYTVDDLKQSYEKCFREFSRLSGGSLDRCDGKLFLPVLGTGEPGWTEQESLEAAWTMAMKFFDRADRFQNYDVSGAAVLTDTKYNRDISLEMAGKERIKSPFQ